MMKILAIDCATMSCSVAVWADGRVLAVERAELPRGQAEALVPMIERVRGAAGVEFAAIDRLAVTVGPGHFTGLRSGLAAARGLALATGRPLIGITTLAAVAAGVPVAERAGAVLVVALDSKRAELYVQLFAADLTPLSAPQARRADAIAAEIAASPASSFVIAGDAAASLVAALAELGTIAALSIAAPRPDAAIVAALAATMPLPTASPAPLYVHPVETTAPRPRAIRA
jgi:tRNA threonylcarbamoyladenosine biosynthesis protein TsaB